MDSIAYSPSLALFSLADYEERDHERHRQIHLMEQAQKLLSDRAFKERLTIFLDDLMSSQKAATLSTLPYTVNVYFEPSELGLLSQLSNINNPRSLAQEVFDTLSETFKGQVDRLQRYHNPKNYNLCKMDQEFKKFMHYLRNSRKCHPETLDWIHEKEYRKLKIRDDEEDRIQMEKEEEEERLRKEREEEEERLRLAKEVKLKESRRRAAEKRRATFLRKKALADIGVEGSKDGSPCEGSSATSATATPTPAPESASPETSTSSPVILTPAEKRRETMKRKKMEKESQEEGPRWKRVKEENNEPGCDHVDTSDSPSSQKKNLISVKLSQTQKIKLKLVGKKAE